MNLIRKNIKKLWKPGSTRVGNPLYLLLTLVGLAFFFSCKDKHSIETSGYETQHWPLKGFVKADSINPILKPADKLSFECPLNKKPVLWEERNVLNPAAVIRNDTVYLFYRAQDLQGTSRIGIAYSTDGLHFTKGTVPILYPANDSLKKYEWNYKKGTETENSEDCYFCYFDGVEDPRIVKAEGGNYIMTYTAYDGKTARLSLAISTDLKNWQKYGPIFKDEKYKNMWSKSGAIVSRLEGNEIMATRIDGTYWMYFGDTDIFMAFSNDLIHWQVAENQESKKMISVLNPRPGYFDSRLVEPGPYALLRDDGILLIYNGSNASNFNDPQLPKFTYSAGQALFNKNIPYKLQERSNTYFIYPDKDYEKVGEVNEVCFVEGLVWFKDRWFLYYGTADSKIAVAVGDVK